MKLMLVLLLLLVGCTSAQTAPPEVRMIDVHGHLGEFAGYDLSLDTLLANVQRAGVERVLVSNIDGADLPDVTAGQDERTVNDETARVCALHPALLPLAWTKPGTGRAADIEPYLRDQGFVGLKFHPDFNHFVADGAAVKPYLALCEKYKVPAFFHCGGTRNSRARTIHAAARAYPSVAVVLYHMGFGTDHQEAIQAVQDAQSRGDAKLYLETAQAEPAAVLDAFRRVGADRILFGTDATYYGKRHYEKYTDMLEGVRAAVSESDYRKFVYGNAAALLSKEDR